LTANTKLHSMKSTDDKLLTDWHWIALYVLMCR